MFSWQQHYQLRQVLLERRVEAWEAIKLHRYSYLVIDTGDSVNSSLLIDSEENNSFYCVLTLDNLIPWLERVFVDKYLRPILAQDYILLSREYDLLGEKMIESDNYFELYKKQLIKNHLKLMPKTLAQELTQKAVELYHQQPQELIDLLCLHLQNL